MSKFIKPKIHNYYDDPFYKEVIEIFGINEPKLKGSYLKYGYEKSCDMDISDSLGNNSFNDYFQKLYNNRKKFTLIKAIIKEPYNKLQIIKDKIGYLDGNFIKHSKGSIINDIEELPDELKKPMKEMVNNYINNQDVNEFIKILLFIKDNIYPSWTLKELLKGEKQYFDQYYKISDLKFKAFYIECLYKNFRISNYIYTNYEWKPILEYEFPINQIMYDNKISYIKLLKKFTNLVKWLYFEKKIKEESLYKNAINLHNNVLEFIDNISSDYNKYCLMQNEIDLSKNKLEKYINKMEKYKNNKYKKYIDKYKKKIKILEEKYTTYMDELNEMCKDKYLPIHKEYSDYYSEYVKYT